MNSVEPSLNPPLPFIVAHQIIDVYVTVDFIV